MADPQGSIRLARNASGAITRFNAYAYGQPVATNTTPPGERGWLGKPLDPGGTVRLDHRTYNSNQNILTNPDPILDVADPPTLNPYAYSTNNPIARTDPSGLSAKCVKEGDCPSHNTPDGGPVVADGSPPDEPDVPEPSSGAGAQPGAGGADRSGAPDAAQAGAALSASLLFMLRGLTPGVESCETDRSLTGCAQGPFSWERLKENLPYYGFVSTITELFGQVWSRGTKFLGHMAVLAGADPRWGVLAGRVATPVGGAITQLATDAARNDLNGGQRIVRPVVQARICVLF